jgi:hypothetical protein
MVKPETLPYPGSGGGPEGKHARAGDGIEFFVPFRGDGLGVELRCRTFFPVLKSDEHQRRIRHVQVVEDVHAADRKGGAHAVGVADDGFNLFQHLIGTLQRGAFRKLNGHKQIALVLVRNETARHHFAEAVDAAADDN